MRPSRAESRRDRSLADLPDHVRAFAVQGIRLLSLNRDSSVKSDARAWPNGGVFVCDAVRALTVMPSKAHNRRA
jgi:hypothetical protein